MIRIRFGGALLAGALLCTALSAQAANTTQTPDTTTQTSGHVSVSSGFDYSSGTYGTQTRTTIWDVPFTIGYDNSDWSLKLVVPYVHISGSNDIIPGVGRVNNGNPSGRGRGHVAGLAGQPVSQTTAGATSGSASGMGDVVAQATYHLFTSKSGRFGIDVGGHIKFGTADENKGLGTGQNDYGASINLFQVVGSWTLFGGAGYTDYGSSSYIQLHDGANANVGASYRTSSQDSIGAYYYWREKISDTGYQESDVTLFWNHHYNANWRLQAYALAGLSNGSPGWGGGLSLKYAF